VPDSISKIICREYKLLEEKAEELVVSGNIAVCLQGTLESLEVAIRRVCELLVVSIEMELS
jgi:hypothetical protein